MSKISIDLLYQRNHLVVLLAELHCTNYNPS